jgi:protein gp37
MAQRLHAMGAAGYENQFKLTLHAQRLEQPMKRKKATVYFVNSMSDLFHDEVPDEFLDQVLEVIRKTPQHTYQILTKRADRLPQYFKEGKCPQNVWLGVSVEDKQHGVPRIDYLRRVSARVRFLSIEPLLEDVGELDLTGIHWVIVGGESGHKARPMRPEWVENIKQQTEEANVSFFFKQWGKWGPDGISRDKKANGRVYRGRTWDEYPKGVTRI